MVPEIKKILYTTDLSTPSQKALGYAVSLANRYDATITILHVMEDASFSTGTQFQDLLGEEKWKQLKEMHEQQAKQVLIGKQKEATLIGEALGNFCQEAQECMGHFGVDDVAVAKGNVVDEIINESQSRQCDLIVMGYHVRGKLEETIAGTTTRRVLRRSKIPVFLVRISDYTGPKGA